MDTARAAAPEGTLTPLEERLARDEFKSRLDRLRHELEDEIRRRLVADRGIEALARSLRKPLPEEIDFMHATRDELASLRRAIHPLARKLAVRLARKRRHGRKGPLDFRSTMRHSLSTGGVPVDPKFRYPRPAKPEIIVIADISGSVASFARFTLHLVHAISSQFSKVRSFVFIDGIDEVTRFFENVDDVADAVHRINTEADVVWVDGHSDYGHALSVFWERWGEEITPRASVLLLGDARNNYHASQAWVVSGDPTPRPPRLLAQPRAPRLLGNGRLHPGRVRRALRRRLRVPEPAPARALRDRAGVSAATRDTLQGAPPGVSSLPRSIAHPTRVVLIRHGEAICNVAGVVGGHVGCTGLSPTGRRQAEALAARLMETGELADVTALYASVLTRALETAEHRVPRHRRRHGAGGGLRPVRAAPGGGGRAHLGRVPRPLRRSRLRRRPRRCGGAGGRELELASWRAPRGRWRAWLGRHPGERS